MSINNAVKQSTDSPVVLIFSNILMLIFLGMLFAPVIFILSVVITWFKYSDYQPIECTSLDIHVDVQSTKNKSNLNGNNDRKIKSSASTTVVGTYKFNYQEKEYIGSTIDCFQGKAMMLPSAYDVCERIKNSGNKICYVNLTNPYHSVLSKEFNPRYDFILGSIIFGFFGVIWLKKVVIMNIESLKLIKARAIEGKKSDEIG
jgi:hypothetical protein